MADTTADDLRSAARILAALADEYEAGKITVYSPSVVDDLDSAHAYLADAEQALSYRPDRD